MKFFICALAVCALSLNAAQAIVVPLALNSPILYSSAYGPGFTSIDNSHPIVVHAPSVIPDGTHLFRSPLIVPVGLNAEATYVAKTAGSEHIASLPGHFPLTYSTFIAPAPIVLPTEAKYVAKNLGVEHIAPLPGHSISTTSLNLEPAPGSK